MAKFLSELDVHLWAGQESEWVLNTPLIFDSDLIGRVEAPAEFKMDLASVPRVPIIYSIWGARAHCEGAIHDYLFRIDSKPEVSWCKANRVFLEAMKVRGKPWYVRYPMFWGVCIGSYPCYHKRNVFE